MDKPAPHVTASAWVVLNKDTSQIVFGRLEKERREVASLTKIMTFFTVLKLCEKMKITYTTEKVTVSEDAEDVTGTSAFLKAED